MGIIPKVSILGHGALAGAPFCDWLNVSFDVGESLNIRDAVRPVVDALGLSQAYEGTYEFPGLPGKLRLSKRHKVFVVSASGAICLRMREQGYWHEYLRVLSQFPHRVTMLHASADFEVESPPLTVREALQAGYAGAVRFTRKSVDPRAVTRQMGLSVIDGTETGTVYFNKRDKADVWARVYDKQQERLVKGFLDPGALVRLEIAVMSDIGATLRDASDPTALFLRFACQTLCKSCGPLPAWEHQAQGFVLSQPSRVPDAHERIRSLMDSSIDVGHICNIARAAFGADALSVLTKLLARRLAQRVMPAAVAAV